MNSAKERLDLKCRFVNTNNSKEYLYSRTEIWSCAYSPHSDYFSWSDRNGVVNIINFKEFILNKMSEKKQEQEHQRNLTCIVEDVNGSNKIMNCGEPVRSLAFGSSKSQVKHKRLHHRHGKSVNLRFKLDDVLILAAGLESGKIRIFDAINRLCFFVLRDHKDIVRELKFTTNNTFQLASVSNDGTIKVRTVVISDKY